MTQRQNNKTDLSVEKTAFGDHYATRKISSNKIKFKMVIENLELEILRQESDLLKTTP